MHDLSAEGNDVFLCDFCAKPWREERPMIEGHQGSLLCAPCLSLACVGAGSPDERFACVLCLREGLEIEGWESPLRPGTRACGDCIRQAARAFAKDPDVAWSPPPGGIV